MYMGASPNSFLTCHHVMAGSLAGSLMSIPEKQPLVFKCDNESVVAGLTIESVDARLSASIYLGITSPPLLV